MPTGMSQKVLCPWKLLGQFASLCSGHVVESSEGTVTGKIGRVTSPLSICDCLPKKKVLSTNDSNKKNQTSLAWFSDKESACHCRRHGLDPGSRKIPHALEQLSPCATIIACALEPVFHDKRNHHNENPMHRNETAAPTHYSQGGAHTYEDPKLNK